MQATTIIDQFKEIETLKDIPTSDLQWMLDQGEVIQLQEGEFIFQPDKDANHLLILLKGRVRGYSVRNGSEKEFGFFEKGSITGVLPYSRMKKASAYAVATEPLELFRLHRNCFSEMIKEHHELTTAFVHLMTSRVREFTSSRLQEDKLMSLGKLSAGLAHELNNPASAILRSAQSLSSHLKAVPEKFKKVIKIQMSDQQVDGLNEILFSKIEKGLNNHLSMMVKSEKEDEIAEWLEEKGVEDGYEFADQFIEFGFEIDDLEKINQVVGAGHFVPVIGWIDNNLTTEKMVLEIKDASERIANLIGAIKTYSHMDQNQDRQSCDIHQGLSSTLRMLEHKIRKNGIDLEEEYENDLPKVEGFPSELNQVFTNIIDNALDAMENSENKVLSIQTEKIGNIARIRIEDSGGGIDPEVVNKIFDPFFTTKEVGKGTGLGLEVVQRIIAKHKGTIKVESRPGKTAFIIHLPIQSE